MAVLLHVIVPFWGVLFLFLGGSVPLPVLRGHPLPNVVVTSPHATTPPPPSLTPSLPRFRLAGQAPHVGAHDLRLCQVREQGVR